MLSYKIIETKSKVKYNNVDFIDLLSNNYKMVSLSGGTFRLSNKYYIARPDLISLAMYGSDEYGDIICKVNGISNPFELNDNTILYIPPLEFVMNCVKGNTNSSTFINSNNNSILDKAKNDYRKKINEKRNSNEMTVENTNYVIDKSLGLIFY